MVEQEVEHMKHYYTKQLGDVKTQLPNLPTEIFKPEADKRVKLGLIVRALVDKHEIKAKEEAVNQKVMEMARHYDDQQAFLSQFSSNRQMFAEVESSVVEDELVKLLLEQVKTSPQTLSFEELKNFKEQDDTEE